MHVYCKEGYLFHNYGDACCTEQSPLTDGGVWEGEMFKLQPSWQLSVNRTELSSGVV